MKSFISSKKGINAQLLPCCFGFVILLSGWNDAIYKNKGNINALMRDKSRKTWWCAAQTEVGGSATIHWNTIKKSVKIVSGDESSLLPYMPADIMSSE